MSRRFTTTIQENDHTGELYIILPDDLTEDLGWLPSDVLTYEIDDSTAKFVKDND